MAIEHVGSTSVRGLAAKPIIDIDVVIGDASCLDAAIAALARIGYRHEGDLGIPGREAFKYAGKDHLQRHHLYVCPQDSAELKRHLAFRDYLRAHPEAVEAYGRIKEAGAALYPEDIDGYIAHKAPFIEGIYDEIGLRSGEADRVTIRPMTPGDYDAVWALWMACKNMGFNDLDDSREGIARLLARNPGTCFVAEVGGALAGVVLAGQDGRRGYIYHMAVAAACRHRGVGSALVERCLAALKAEGIHKVALLVFKYNDTGNAFWERQGFTVREDVNYRNRALAELKRIDT